MILTEGRDNGARGWAAPLLELTEVLGIGEMSL